MTQKLLTGLSFFIISFYGFTQTNEITIRFIGNCGLHFSDGVTNIYTDFPYKSGAHHYMEYEEAELDSIRENAYFIFTHKHSDHYYKGQMKKILKEKKGKQYGKWDIEELEKLSDTIPDFEIKAFKSKHLYSFSHFSYLITWHGKKFYLSGDTEHAETILTMTNLDWAFLPAWLINSIVLSGKDIDTKKLGVYHIGPRDNVQITGERALMLKTQGEIIKVSY